MFIFNNICLYYHVIYNKSISCILIFFIFHMYLLSADVHAVFKFKSEKKCCSCSLFLLKITAIEINFNHLSLAVAVCLTNVPALKLWQYMLIKEQS